MNSPSTDFSDDEGDESEKENEEPEEWGKFLHLKERVSVHDCAVLIFEGFLAGISWYSRSPLKS